MEALDLIQWPAMLITLVASWYVTSTKKDRRKHAFWLFILSNVLWIVWGLHAQAHALIALQVGLAIMNTLGAKKNERSQINSL